MKNITVSVDEETHRLARIRAAELDTSVSALVRKLPEESVWRPRNGGGPVGRGDGSRTPAHDIG